MKILFKTISILLIQAMLAVNCAGAFEEACVLSPVLQIDAESVRYIFYSAQEAIDADLETGFFKDDRFVLENNSGKKGRFILWMQKLAGLLHNKFFRRFFRIRKILGFIMRGENAGQKTSIATSMIMTNLSLDIYLTTIIIKPAIIAACILSGNFFLTWIVAPLSPFLVGGIIRLLPAVFFRIIFINSVRLSRAGILLNFIPWGIGNFAPVLFLKETEPQDLWLAKETRKLSRLIEKSVVKHADATAQEISMVQKYSVEIAVAIQDCQSCLNGYSYRRFKIRGTKGYSEEKIRRAITLVDLGMKTYFAHNLQARILARLGIFHPGHRKGTRPILLFGHHQSLMQIKKQMRDSGLSREYLQRIYQFDMSEFAEAMINYEKIHSFSFLEEIRTIAEKFIVTMFSEAEIEDASSMTMTGVVEPGLPVADNNVSLQEDYIRDAGPEILVRKIVFPPLILESI